MLSPALKNLMVLSSGALLLTLTTVSDASSYPNSAYNDREGKFSDYKGESEEWDFINNFNFDSCEWNTFVCCWTDKSDTEFDHNAVLCDEEYNGLLHCHGAVWPENPMGEFREYLTYKVMYQHHIAKKGYYGSVPGYEQCGCLEDMPRIDHADCTRYRKVSEAGSASLKACTGNKLRNEFRTLYPELYPPSANEGCDS